MNDPLLKGGSLRSPHSPEVLDSAFKAKVEKDLDRALKGVLRSENAETFQRQLQNLRNVSIKSLREVKRVRRVAGNGSYSGGGVSDLSPPMGCATGSLLMAFFLSFIIIGMLWFCFVEKLPPIDALYLIVIIFTTVGYGMKDELETERLQLFLIFYVSFGVCLIFTGVNFYFARTLGRILSRVDEPESSDEPQDSEGNVISEIESIISDFRNRPDKIGFHWLVFMWLSWLLGGAYLIAELEKWSFLEATYFAVISGSTVGFGDFEPEDIRTKYFIIFYLPPLIVFTLFIFTHSFAVSVKFFVDETFSPHAFNDTKISGFNTPTALSFRSSISARSPANLRVMSSNTSDLI